MRIHLEFFGYFIMAPLFNFLLYKRDSFHFHHSYIWLFGLGEMSYAVHLSIFYKIELWWIDGNAFETFVFVGRRHGLRLKPCNL
jgi:hypothetical protein